MGAISSINILFRANLKQFSSEIQNASREMKKYGNQLQGIGNTLSIGLTLPIAAAGAASIKMASDYNESLNKVDVAFKNSSAQVKEFAKDSLESFGIAEGTALDMAATFGDMATSMGLSTGAASQMSTSLVGLAGDLASFKNIGIDQATTALNGVFTGETESLKRLGIVMTEANLQTFALSKGIKTQVKDMDQASKVNLRYAYIMANTTNAQGDFVRTGGGAANQMRIFQESLKQLGQQFGAVILPAFTKAITYVNGMIKGFSELSPATKETIVIIAGVAAAIGPLLTAVGKLLTFLPSLALSVKNVGKSFSDLKAFAATNPYVALAAAIAVVGVAVYGMVREYDKFTNAERDFATVTKQASQSVAAQSAELQKNLAVAKNKALSDDVRKKAIENINKLSPEYLGNITLENLYTRQSTEALTKWNEQALKRAKIQAAEEKLVDVQKKLQELQLGNLDAVQPTTWQSLANSIKAVGTGYGAFASQGIKAKTVQENLNNETKQLIALQNKLLALIGSDGTQETKTVYDDVVTGINAITDATKSALPGTIAFYEGQISELQKLQKEQTLTNNQWQIYESRIEAIQLKIDALTNKGIKLPKPELPEFDGNVPAFSIGNLEEQKAYYENLRTQFSTTSDEYAKYTELINNTQIKINAIQGVEEAKTQIDSVKTTLESFNESVTAVMNNVAASFVEGFGQVIANFASGGNVLGSIGNLFLSTLAGLMEQVGKIAIQTGIAISGIKASLKSLNPALAIGAGVALIALSSVIKSQMASASAGAFANGGIVGGTSTFGDKLFAQVNSGEMILNKSQQRNLSNMINPAVSAGDVAIQLMGGFEIDGTKLRLVLDRTDNKKKRQG